MLFVRYDETLTGPLPHLLERGVRTLCQQTAALSEYWRYGQVLQSTVKTVSNTAETLRTAYKIDVELRLLQMLQLQTL